jgi:hypothetical protein
MVIRLAAREGSAFLFPVTGGDVRLHAYYRFDSGFARLLLKFPGGVQIAVVRYRERWLFQLLRSRNKTLYAIGSVQERIFGVAMQVYERHEFDNIRWLG